MKGVYSMKTIVYCLMFILLITTVFAVDITQITDTEGTETSIDLAYDSSGNSHLVYERAGTVYYQYDDGSETTIGSGNKPVICVDTSDNVHVAYLDGNNIYYTSKDNTWSTPENLVAGNDVDIACDSIVHMAYTNTDSKPDIMYLSVDNGIASIPLRIKDGFYWYENGGRTGRYFYSPRITTDGSDYYIAYKHYALDGAMGWTDWYTYVQVYNSADGTTFSTPYKYKAHYSELSKNALSYTDGPVVFYNYGSTLYKGTGNWVQTEIDTASAPAAAENQLAFVKDGEIKFHDGSELFIVGQGSDPAVGNDIVYFTMNGDIYRTGGEAQEEPCVDADEDGYFTYDPETCIEGTDCNDNDNTRWRVDYFYYDFDGDSFHAYGQSNMNSDDQIAVCYGNSVPEHYMSDTLGRDCDDNDYDPENDCSEPCVDEDDDGYCAEEDCNDNNPDSWRIDSYWVDYDEDGYHLFGLANMDEQDRIAICYGEEIPYPYVIQTLGRDCNDDDSLIWEGCGDQGGDDPVDVPEFGLIGAALVLIGGLVVMFRRR